MLLPGRYLAVLGISPGPGFQISFSKSAQAIQKVSLEKISGFKILFPKISQLIQKNIEKIPVKITNWQGRGPGLKLHFHRRDSLVSGSRSITANNLRQDLGWKNDEE